MGGNRSLWLTALFAVSLFCSSSALAQLSVIEEVEPNNPCMDAQVLDGVPLPFSISGSLDSTETEPDVDFFRVSGAAGQYVSITLEGAATGMGTLGDPFLGFFNADCQLIAVSDDYGGTVNSRLSVQLPDGGDYILGATQCCDSEFLGGGTGSYVLNVYEVPGIEQISGRVVDADTLVPLPGDSPPYAFVWLISWNEFWNIWIDNQPTAPDGTFAFTSNSIGDPLEAGTYLLYISAQGYESTYTETFEVNEGESLELGDLLLNPIELIGSVSGRLVDARQGWPLPGNSPPYAFAVLERQEEWGWYPVVGNIYSDEQGMFFIDGVTYGVGPGNFRVMVYADDYYPLATEAFELGNKESADLGDLPVMPLPIAFSDVTGCEVLLTGEACDFSVKVHNRGMGRYRGEAWSIVGYTPQTFPNRGSTFQIGRTGVRNPNPVRINLAEDGWTTLKFRLEIPEFVQADSWICVFANVGRDPRPQFNAAGDRMLFCATTQTDGSLSRLSSKESRHLLRESNSRRE